MITSETPTPAPAPRPKGLSCPRCGKKKLVVTGDYEPAAGVRWRYRRCSNCGAKLKSRETLVATRTVEVTGPAVGTDTGRTDRVG